MRDEAIGAARYQDFDLQSCFLAEIAAQLAELNEKAALALALLLEHRRKVGGHES